jgi:hypothetical protein
MKNLLCFVFVFCLTIFTSAHADESNLFFGKHPRQIALHVGGGVNSGFIVPPPTQWVPFSMLHFQYSIPSTFFRLPARQSIGVIQTIGFDEKYGWNWHDYTIPIFMLSEDVALIGGKNWYFGTGMGIGMQGQQNERIGSKLVFGFKLLGGFRISEHTNMEIFMQHISNGNTAPSNNSYAFYGIGITYNF